MSEVLRTPDEAFIDLPDFPFRPHYFNWGDIRMHYLDEGSGPPVLLFHGEPTWSFLYRKVIPPLVEAGYRCIAPDYVGLGKSDKPTDDAFYTYDMHSESVAGLLGSLELSNATVVGQDWGGPIGLRYAVEHPDAVQRLVILNTGLFSGRGSMPDAWMAFREWVARTPDLPVDFLMSRSEAHPWGEAVLQAYGAPFPSVEYKAGIRRFPMMVPLSLEDDAAPAMLAVRDRLAAWDRPAYVLFSTGDPIFSPKVGAHLAELIPGAGELDTIDDAGHFLQEDQGEEVGRRIAAWLDSTG
ncbi:MAG: alpha/beta fold hydrolase [Acidimicrobiia bacterium]|nr:alpha/beta fold hydrolase [Acidimicrobiia bacterium]MBT8216853.1 alpha/beta fold hydrolase [Acidimicrobiia bacterium]NNF11382.1 alpha/beta fold hydrolase [Acidimicrobiia bacterium]NNL68697.1 alpha/beta fold hydrolase [Acidimicrobiia bacterium]